MIMTTRTPYLALVAMGALIPMLGVLAIPAVAGGLVLEGGAGMTLWPERGAQVVGVIGVNLLTAPADWPIVGGKSLFADFGIVNGTAFLGPAISFDDKWRGGWAAWTGHELKKDIYIRYAVPFTFDW